MSPLTPSENIALIGMPGVGKSTVGVLLAKALSRDFVDTDLIIQSGSGQRLQDIIDSDGLEAFYTAEEGYVLNLAIQGAVIATGGSVPYSAAAMAHLKSTGRVVHLDLPLPELEARITNMDSRGIARGPGQTMTELFTERQPLYRCYADITLDCTGLNHEQVVEALLARL